MQIRRTAAALTSAVALSITGAAMATPAQAARPVVTGGLVNVTLVDVVDVNDVNVIAQVPIGVAANVCNLSVAAVLAAAATEGAACEASNEQLPTAFQE